MRKIVMGCLCVAIVLSGCGGEKKNPQSSLAIPSTSVSEQKKEQETEDQVIQLNVIQDILAWREGGVWNSEEDIFVKKNAEGGGKQYFSRSVLRKRGS